MIFACSISILLYAPAAFAAISIGLYRHDRLLFLFGAWLGLLGALSVALLLEAPASTAWLLSLSGLAGVGALVLVLRLDKRARMTEAKALALEEEARAMSHSGSSQLAASRSRFRHLVEVTPLGIFEADTSGKVVFVSTRWQELTGLNARAAKGDGWLSSVLEEDRERIARAWGLALAAGRSFEMEWPVAGEGEISWVYCQATPRTNPLDGTRTYIGTLTDVSDRKRAEEERRRSDESLAQKLKLESLGVMAGGVAHDFNNLLVGVLGNAELLKGGASEKGDHKDLICRIEEAARRAADLAHQMLVFAGQGVVESIPLDISVVVHGSLRLFDADSRKRLNSQLGEGMPSIRVDRTRLQQIVTNLVRNALEASISGEGAVEVRTELRQVSAEELERAQIVGDIEPGEVAILEVVDSGCGIEAGDLPRIFDPFYSTKFTGRGLGLGVVTGAVQANGATMAVESSPGSGTRVRIYFKLDGASPVSAPESDVTLNGSADGYLLVVDDEPIVRTTIQAILERSGYSVFSAEGGLQGVEILRREGERLDAVLLDMTMPGMNGRETLRAMRAINEKIPVLLLSGHSEEEVRRAFADEDLAGFVLKPFTGASLLGVLERALR